MDGSRKWNVNNTACMNVPDFCASEAEFPTSEPMGANGDLRPRSDFLFYLLHMIDDEPPIRVYFEPRNPQGLRSIGLYERRQH